jgi:hypothetical protein
VGLVLLAPSPPPPPPSDAEYKPSRMLAVEAHRRGIAHARMLVRNIVDEIGMNEGY